MTCHRSIALIGANGMLATAIRKLAPAGYSLHGYDQPEFDLTDREQVLSLQELSPDIIINCAAYTDVDGCEQQSDMAMRVNGSGVGLLADLAKKTDAVLVHISTDFVFDGKKGAPYLEDDQPQPLSIYGKSKLEGERQILQSGLEKYLIVRTSWLYGAGGNNFVETIIRLAKERSELKVVADQRGTPTWTEDLAAAIFVLLDGASNEHEPSRPVTDSALPVTAPYGLYHYSNAGECSWYEFAAEIIDQARKMEELTVKTVSPIPTESYPLPAARPKNSVLSKEKIVQATGIDLPTWQSSLERYLSNKYKRRFAG